MLLIPSYNSLCSSRSLAIAMNAYKFITSVADCVLDNGAVIFGGYLRDIILHNHAAQAFYRATEKLSDQETRAKYNDPTFMPENADRCLLANDIDCFTSTANIPKLEKALKTAGFHVGLKENKELHNYQIVSEGMKLTTVHVSLAMTPVMRKLGIQGLRGLRVKLDIVHCDNISDKEPPFSEVDYECNAFIMDESRQLRLSNSVFNRCDRSRVDPLRRLAYMNEVIERLVEKRCIAVGDNVAPWRTSKMVDKGFEVLGKDMKFKVTSPPSGDDDTMCALCLDKVCYEVLKRKCCSATYHTKCFRQLVCNENFKWSCPQCRDNICPYEVKRNKMLWEGCRI